MEFLFVKPAPGREARHEAPPHAPISHKGELVPATPYYLRQRDLHGDTVDTLPAYEPAAIIAETGPTLSEGGNPPADPPPAVERRKSGKSAATKPNTKQED